MKIFALFATLYIAASSAFSVQTSKARFGTALGGEPLFKRITGLDLFAPNPDINTYGARKKKNLAVGKIQPGKSYVPDGLTPAQYEKVRAQEIAKKEQNYEKNVKKAGKFQNFTEFYKKRGTDLSQGWIKSVTRGHEMVKTKYDWSGKKIESAGWFTPPAEKKK